MRRFSHRRSSHARGRVLPALVLVCVAACAARTKAPTAAPDSAAASTCGPRGERFADLAWVPERVRLATLIAVDDPDLTASEARLAGWLSASREPLPVYAGMEYSQLRVQREQVVAVLAAAGFHPSQLLRLIGSDGELAWAWSSSCDLAEVRAHTREAWRMELRETVEGRAGRSRDPDFPFELLLLSGGRALLVPVGQAQRSSLWLAQPGPRGGPGEQLTAAEPAPIVSLVQGTALLLGEAAPRGDRLLLRATPTGVELTALSTGGTSEPPPAVDRPETARVAPNGVGAPRG